MLVQINQSLEDLVEEALGLVGGEGVISTFAHELFKIELKVLKDQIELILRVNYFFQSKFAKSVS